MAAIERVEVGAYTIPVDLPDRPETDGTLAWDATTIVVVEAHAGGEIGIGYTYQGASAATLVDQTLASAHACVGLWHLRHLEYFHDHARIEGMLFAGALDPAGGTLRPDLSRPGLGIEFKRADANAYAA